MWRLLRTISASISTGVSKKGRAVSVTLDLQSECSFKEEKLRVTETKPASKQVRLTEYVTVVTDSRVVMKSLWEVENSVSEF